MCEECDEDWYETQRETQGHFFPYHDRDMLERYNWGTIIIRSMFQVLPDLHQASERKISFADGDIDEHTWIKKGVIRGFYTDEFTEIRV